VGFFDWYLMTFFFTATYVVIVQPALSFGYYFGPFILVGFVSSGWGYLISCAVPPSLGPFMVSIVIFILGGSIGNPEKMPEFLSSPTGEAVVSILSFARWSVEMSFKTYLDHVDVAPTGMDKIMLDVFLKDYAAETWATHLWGYYWTGALVLFLQGLVLRGAAFLALCFTNRGKQV
jgi:hypothetical protein